VREDGIIAGGKEWQEKVYDREEWKEASDNGKESSHSAHANGIEYNILTPVRLSLMKMLPSQ
jgi:hypothetical protein